jgi:hypothetical protein
MITVAQARPSERAKFMQKTYLHSQNSLVFARGRTEGILLGW